MPVYRYDKSSILQSFQRTDTHSQGHEISFSFDTLNVSFGKTRRMESVTTVSKIFLERNIEFQREQSGCNVDADARDKLSKLEHAL